MRREIEYVTSKSVEEKIKRNKGSIVNSNKAVKKRKGRKKCPWNMQNKKAKLSPNRLVTINIISLNSPIKRQRHPIKNKKQTKTPALCCL